MAASFETKVVSGILKYRMLCRREGRGEIVEGVLGLAKNQDSRGMIFD